MKADITARFSNGWVYSIKRFTSLLGLLLILQQLVGCAGAPKDQQTGPQFYPPLPNSPRIQYLASFSTGRDVGEQTAFADFVFGKDGEVESLVKKPYGVAIADGKIFAADTRGQGYVIFDLKNKKTASIYGSGAGRIKKPINILLDEQFNRYLTDTERNQILVFNKQNKFVRAYGVKGQFKPTDLALTRDRMYVVDIEHHNLQVLSRKDGRVLDKIGSPGSGSGQFFHPTNISIGGDGNLYVSDTGNFRVQVITPQGEFVRSIGKAGTGLGNFARPKGVAVDRQGQIYVVDAAFNNVQVFRPDGRLLVFFGGAGNDPGNLYLPTDVAIDYENVALFQKYADPKFKLEYVIVVASQFGSNKISVYGYGRMEGMEY